MITIQQVKAQCRIEHDEEDVLLAGYITAAISFAQSWIDGQLDESNPAHAQALLLLVAHWYENREAEQRTPTGFYALMQPYRKIGI